MFLLSKLSSKQIFSWHALTMLSDCRLWNPYNFPRLLGYRSELITIVKLGSVLSQLQVAFSLLFNVFAQGGLAWFYNIFDKLQSYSFNPDKRSEVPSKKPRRIKSGLQIFSWHPGSLSNHKYLVFHTKRKLRDLFFSEPSFMVNARRADYRANAYMRNKYFKKKFRRPSWQRRNRFWRYKRLSRVKSLDTRRLLIRNRKITKRKSLSFMSSKKVHLRKFRFPMGLSLPLMDNYFIFAYGPLVRENITINRSIYSYLFNLSSKTRAYYPYLFFKKPKIVIPEIELIKPGTPEQPNVLPVDNMPTGSARRIQKKKRKIYKKLYDPFYTEVSEDFYLLKENFFSDLVYKEKRWFSFAPFLVPPRKRYRRISKLMFLTDRTSAGLVFRFKFPKRISSRYRPFFKIRYSTADIWHHKRFFIPEPKKKFKRKFRRNFKKKHKFKRFARRTHYFRTLSSSFDYVDKLLCISARISRLLYRSKDYVFGNAYTRYFRCHFRMRRLSKIHSNIDYYSNPYYKLPLNPLSSLVLKKISNFNRKFDRVNAIKFLKRYHKIRYFKRRKMKAGTLLKLPGKMNISLKKYSSLGGDVKASLVHTFTPRTKLSFSKKTLSKRLQKTYVFCKKPYYSKKPLQKIRPIFLKKLLTRRYRRRKFLGPHFPTLVKMKKKLLSRKALLRFRQFSRSRKATRLFPSVLLVASLSRYALSVLNEAQCVGVSLIYFTDAAVSPVCNLFNVVMNSKLNILSSTELHINLIYNKAKVFNLISRVW